MQSIREISPDIFYVGASDRKLPTFENQYPLPRGMAYNAYAILDEKIALMDTVDISVKEQYEQNLVAVLKDRMPDYLVIDHMEPDHGAFVGEICGRYPELKLVGTAMTKRMMAQFFDFDVTERFVEVKEGDTLPLGKKELRFFAAPMVHWPEVMFSYETTSRTLFSADAFGAFGALPGALFVDEINYKQQYIDEMRRYYANIVGKYGDQVQAALKKLEAIEIDMICPLHGLLWKRQDMDCALSLYNYWSKYEPEEAGVVIAYASMYGHTASVAQKFADMLAQKGVKKITVLDLSKVNVSYVISEIFRYSHLVLAAPTYNMGLFAAMHNLLYDMQALNVQKRKVVVIGNGSWAPQSPVLMQKMLEECKEMEIVGAPLVIKSALKENQQGELEALVDAVAQGVAE